MNDLPYWTVLAHLLRPQGRKGEILADLLTDFPERFTRRGRLFLAEPRFQGPIEEARSVEITASWLPKGKNEGRIVFAVAGCSDIEQASLLAGLDLLTPREDRIRLPDDEVYISDLVGCDLFDGARHAGIIQDVRFPTSADGRKRLDVAPLLILRAPDGSEILVPFVKDFLKAVDLPQRRLMMNLPRGLLDVDIDAAEEDPSLA